MKLHYWGTAAAEGIPGLFCDCPVCREAREKGGRFVRTRSQILIDDSLMLDFNADTYMHSLKYGFNLGRLKNVIISHVHEDHYYPLDLCMRDKGFAPVQGNATLTVHGSKDVKPKFDYITEGNDRAVRQGRVAFKELEPFVTYDVDGYEITPMPARHGTSNPFVYAIKKGDASVLILNDTGYLLPETLEFLKNNDMKFDLISYDCTYCAGDTLADWGPNAGHMGLVNIVELRKELTAMNKCKDTTLHIVTHFSHNGPKAGYADMREEALKYGFVITYDGYEIEVK